MKNFFSFVDNNFVYSTSFSVSPYLSLSLSIFLVENSLVFYLFDYHML